MQHLVWNRVLLICAIFSIILWSDTDSIHASPAVAPTIAQAAQAACTGNLIQEAENGAIFGAMMVGNDETASGGQFVSVPSQGVSTAAVNSFNPKHRIEFCFNVAAAGTYRIEGDVYAEDGRSDSFFVTVDGAPAEGYLWRLPIDTSYQTDGVNDNGNSVMVELSAGDHIITIYHRENDARLDKLTLVPQNPTNQDLTVCAVNGDYTTIQAAIDAAAPGVTIDICAGTYLENITINKDITLRGEAAETTIVDGQGLATVIAVQANTDVTIENLTITNGLGSNDDPILDEPGGSMNAGGGIWNEGRLTLASSIVDDNQALRGIGIYNMPNGLLSITNSQLRNSGDLSGIGGGLLNRDGVVEIKNSLIHNNTTLSDGAGIYNTGRLSITDSTIRNNSNASRTTNDGGGIRNTSVGEVTMLRTTVSGNSAGRAGGGIRNAGKFIVINSTISNNSAGFHGGISSGTNGPMTIRNSTVTTNIATAIDGGGGTSDSNNTVTLANTIVSDNTNGDCIGTTLVTSAGHNIDSDGTCNLTEATDQPDTDPLLGPLADNGGPTQTHALLPGSPAHDAGDCSSGAVIIDQRGITRPQGDGCDIGAYEAEAAPSGCGPLAQEAEAGTLFGVMIIGNDQTASGGQFVYVPDADESTAQVQSAALRTKHRVDYCITVTEAGDYRIRTQVLAPDNRGNSFFVQVDGAPEDGITYDIFPVNGTYVTDYVSQRGGADPAVFNLTPGDHTISFVLREDGARLDSFTLEPVNVAAASVHQPTTAELRQNQAAEESSNQDVNIFVPLITR